MKPWGWALAAQDWSTYEGRRPPATLVPRLKDHMRTQGEGRHLQAKKKPVLPTP